MMKWFKSNKDDSQKESKGNKRLTAEQKAAKKAKMWDKFTSMSKEQQQKKI